MLISMTLSHKTMGSPLQYDNEDCTTGYLRMVQYTLITYAKTSPCNGTYYFKVYGAGSSVLKLYELALS